VLICLFKVSEQDLSTVLPEVRENIKALWEYVTQRKTMHFNIMQ
jgi:hypothetical protein